MYKTAVLLIDELYFSKHIIKTILADCNVTVSEANSPAEGLQLFLKIKPSVVIFGASMANDTGLKLAKAIRKYCNNVKIIFIFKTAFKHTVADVFVSGGNALLVLPLNNERLLEEISPQAKTRKYTPASSF